MSKYIQFGHNIIDLHAIRTVAYTPHDGMAAKILVTLDSGPTLEVVGAARSKVIWEAVVNELKPVAIDWPPEEQHRAGAISDATSGIRQLI